jgi:hypothetical protein
VKRTGGTKSANGGHLVPERGAGDAPKPSFNRQEQAKLFIELDKRGQLGSALKRLRVYLGAETFDTWFSEVVVDVSAMTLFAPNRFTAARIRQEYLERLSEFCGQPVRVQTRKPR